MSWTSLNRFKFKDVILLCLLFPQHQTDLLSWSTCFHSENNFTHHINQSSSRVVKTSFVSAGRRGQRNVTFLLSDGGVLAVGQRTRRAVTQPRDVVLITTEALALCPERRKKNTESQLQLVFFTLHVCSNLLCWVISFVLESKVKKFQCLDNYSKRSFLYSHEHITFKPFHMITIFRVKEQIIQFNTYFTL